ncbi:alpha/beta hydrolase [Actinosynnema mirum]|uniref:Serine aminopeptidase S33 domain-containing protein n=1 Tax=Actinosynnema mirum (strain ATCC 29888 / DSM 43827 / JCM 3225 / NBRC 14064 / NCIMB 13271 / NRRL B-12336 / IMRU 3971 / 101) TaxID=446462 RepID=C6WLM1_ACTMD|nr:alpha/beta hydrolase [Actinosynnema mirum]ACU38414.1 hypothetical protein Amir_4576 [Actinosynnema mirum DSM 43827]
MSGNRSLIAIAERADAALRQAPQARRPPGRLVPLDTHRRLHVVEPDHLDEDGTPRRVRGSARTDRLRLVTLPVLGALALEMLPVLRELTGRVEGVWAMAYDRAGMGWSPAAPGGLAPRTPTALAAELLELLDALDRQDGRLPVVLVGHSLGGLVARAAAAMCPPGRIAGMVLIEPSHEDARAALAPLDRAVTLRRQVRALGSRLLGTTGWWRARAVVTGAGMHPPQAAVLPAAWRARAAWRVRGPAHQAAWLRERAGVLSGAAAARGLPDLGDLPLWVLSRTEPGPAKAIWRGLHERTRRLSTAGRLLPMPEGIGHFPHYERQGHEYLVATLESFVRALVEQGGASATADVPAAMTPGALDATQ